MVLKGKKYIQFSDTLQKLGLNICVCFQHFLYQYCRLVYCNFFCVLENPESDTVKSGSLIRLGSTGRQMNTAAIKLSGGSMTSSIGNTMGFSGLNNFITSGDPETDVLYNDIASIDDVLNILKGDQGETSHQGSTSTII